MKYYLSILIFISSLNASNLDNELKKEVICDTRESCNKLSLEIQRQIDEIESSQEPDFDKLDVLQNKLIVIENQKQRIQKEIIKSQNIDIKKSLNNIKETLE